MLDRRTTMAARMGALALLIALTAGCSDEAAAPAAAAQDRAVVHAMGRTTVPDRPERVVVLDTGELDSAVALGVVPVGAVVASQGGDFPSYLRSRLEGVEKLGTIAQPNLEAIAALGPDLILSSRLRHEAIYPQLSQIAPTVFTQEVGVTWKENFRLHAEALGRTGEAEELLGRYERAASQIRASVQRRGEPLEISVIRSMPNQVRIMMRRSFIGTVLADAGLTRPPAQDKDVFMEEGSEERVPDMNGDLILVSRYGQDHARLDAIMATPQWKALPAVQAGAVREINDDVWMLGIGIVAATTVVEELPALLPA